jgi:hypothetical protein
MRRGTGRKEEALVTWIKDGKPDGTGAIVKGNPNNF